jgi:hypothetical protein
MAPSSLVQVERADHARARAIHERLPSRPLEVLNVPHLGHDLVVVLTDDSPSHPHFVNLGRIECVRVGKAQPRTFGVETTLDVRGVFLVVLNPGVDPETE